MINDVLHSDLYRTGILLLVIVLVSGMVFAGGVKCLTTWKQYHGLDDDQGKEGH